ncbi:phage tail protein [Marinomonas spartinae]|uniref:phage tail protein n=1 Tax=Marinomonas spartinae TaxID=1792290 RepID=UPI0018F1B770|nr:phage tail protein [Marinomonas spartinae]MBJ7555390.1 phage tail protein [Marinomonas spartinae]
MKLKGIDKFQRKLKRIGGTELRRAASSALNKTGALARTRIIKGVAASAKVPVGQVRKRVYLARSTARTLKIVQIGYARPISLVALIRNPMPDQGQRRKRQLRVNKKAYPNAFIRQGVGGKTQVFERNGKKGRQGKGRWAKYKNLERLDKVGIEIQPTVEKVLPKVQRRVYNANFRRLFAHEYNFRLSKL